MPAGCGYPRLGSVGVNLIADPRRISGLRIDQLHIRNIQPRFLIYDSAAAIARRFLMTLDHGCAFDFYFAARWGDREHASALAFVAPDNHDHLVILSDFDSLISFHLYPSCALRQITSGANETIFMKFLSRNSRATGPNTRVPIGVPSSLINTAAF